MPILGGNDVELFGKTEEVVAKLIEDIGTAKEHVHMLYYIFYDDETGTRVANALIEAAKRGVTCRLIVDAVGSRSMIGGPLWQAMKEAGVKAVAALPVQPLRRSFARIDVRNHRKLAVFDGSVAYTGSQNMVNADYGHRTAGQWFDLTGRFTGPIVAELQGVFVEDWVFETDEDISEQGVFAKLDPTGDVAAQAVPTTSMSPCRPRIRDSSCRISAESSTMRTRTGVPGDACPASARDAPTTLTTSSGRRCGRAIRSDRSRCRGSRCAR